MKNIHTILFIELLGGIGDLVIALPAIHALGRSHPLAQLTVLTFAPGGELLEADPFIHRIVYTQPGKARRAVDEILADEYFDLIISDTNYDGIAESIRNYCRISSHKPVGITNLWRSPPPNEFISDRFLKILWSEGLITREAIDWDEPQIHLTAAEKRLGHHALGASYRPIVFLCPDAGMAIKRWSTNNFVTLGKALQQQHGATIIVPVGSDQDQAEHMARAIGGQAQVWQRDSLRHLAAAIAQADLLIAADTGPARIAAALNIPTLTLFGPSWSGRYGQPAPHMNLQGFPDCPERIIHNFTEQKCWYSNQCPFEWDTCLDDISPDTVLHAATTLLTQSNWETRNRYSSSLTPPASPLPSSLSSLPSVAPPWNAIRKLLIMRLDNIGDVIMTTPALRAIREQLPEANITLMVSPSGAFTQPLLPWVNDVLPWRVLWQDLGRLDFDPEREWSLIETLGTYHFDAAIILTSFSQSPHPAALICALAGIPIRLGESKELDIGTLTHFVPPAPDDIHQVDRNLRLIESVGFQVRDRRLALQIPPNAEHAVLQRLLQQSYSSIPQSSVPETQNPNLLSFPPYILLNPWTTCQSRNYDPHRFAAAARQLSDVTGWSVVVTGVEKDRDRSRSLLDVLGHRAIDMVGKTSLAEMVALVARAKLVLTNNTSTMHIADAVGTPAVILFAGTEQESQWRPRHSPSYLLRRATVCSPCYAFTCPHELQCLDIPSESVIKAGLKLITNTN